MLFDKKIHAFKGKIQESSQNISSLKELIQYRFSNIWNGRTFKQSILADNFPLLLESWGIEERQITQVYKDLKGRLFLYLFVFLIATLLALQNKIFMACLLYICSFVGFTTSIWRMNILKNKRFISYSNYLYLFIRIDKIFK